MNKLHGPLFVAALGLIAPGCIVANNNNTASSPGTGSGGADAGTGGDAGDGSGDAGSGKKSRARDSISSRGTGAKGRQAVKISSDKPPIDEDGPTRKPPRARDKASGKKLDIGNFAPTAAAPGSMVEIYGSSFGDDASAITVTVGGVAWTVDSVYEDRILVVVPDGAVDGQIEVKVGKAKGKTDDTFSVLEDDGGIAKPADSLNGLLGEVFPLGGEVTALPDFSSLGDPSAIIAVPNLDIPVRGFDQGFPGVDGDLVEWFAIRFNGSFNVVEGGEYDLCLNSDDGSKLYLEDTLVVDNDGVHSSQEACELVYLEPGEYLLRIEYFQGPRNQIALEFFWAKDGGEKVIVPSDVLFRPVDDIQ